MSQEIGTEDVKRTVQNRILNAAEELFAKSSYAGTRISEIAAKAEVNQALIHYYFGSKEGLYREVLARLFEQWEQYVEALSWDDLEPVEVIKHYIAGHFEIKCRMPNLYKIFHWEALEGGELFDKYASSTWVQDFVEKRELFKQWKAAGILAPHVNESVVLFSLWGMMNQFYYRSEENLKFIAGHDGGLTGLQEEIAEQMIRLTLHGILPQPTAAKRREESPKAVVLQAFGSDTAVDAEHEEADKLLEAITHIARMDAVLVHGEREALEALRNGGMLFVFASTMYGEVPQPVYKLLERLEAEPSAVIDRLVGIWVLRNNPAAETLQRMLEDAFNRIGAFSVARVAGQTTRDYARRYAKLLGM